MKLNVDNFLPNLSITCVVIGFEDDELKVLTLKWKKANLWTLPVGFIEKNIDIDHSAIRILQNRTGLKLPFSEQFHTFGSLERRKHASNKIISKYFSQVSEDFAEWVDQRFVGVAYVSLVDIQKCNITPDTYSDTCEWIAIDKIPKLLYDHNQMIDMAIQFLRVKLNYLPFGISLMPEKFTMKQLQKLYECILQKKLDRGNFQRKILKLNILIRLEKQKNGGGHMPPYLYKFDKEAYDALVEKGIGFTS